MKYIIIVLLCIFMLFPACTTETELTLEQQRLDRLVERLEQERETSHIPGMAIAVVQDDEIILTHGFGVTDIEKQTPVTPETVFAIGSSTKAFTSTLIGMLVDEGKMDWDDPVTKYIPYFELNIDSQDQNAEVTIRDMLCHRTGFTRMGILIASGMVPREEVLQAATKAEPWTGFRKKFYYTNVMYLASGVAAGKAANKDWDTLVAERIFEPLGMSNSTTSIKEAQADTNLARGYIWDRDLEKYRGKPFRTIDNIGPAGSINSNVIDMAQWIRFQLNRGEYEGEHLLSEKQHRETWTSQIALGEKTGYGLGWFVREWNGQPLIEHGGNVDGFSAQVALLPESDLGFVLLTNASVAPVSQSINIVFDTLLGEWEEAEPEDKTADYEPYIGEYTANFGPFQNEVFTVMVKNNHLAIDVPGQQIYELKEPDSEGKWYFVITDAIAVSFERDNGNVTMMKLYQSGLTFELPKKGVEIPVESPAVGLEKYLGSYRSDELGVTAEVLIQNNNLAINWPGEMVYELYPPDKEGVWAFRVSKDFTLRFNETPDGTIDSLTYNQKGKIYRMTRLEGYSAPTLEEISALRETDKRIEALQNMGTYRFTGTVYSAQSGVEGTVSVLVSGNDRYRVDTDYGKFGESRTALNGDRGWTEFTNVQFEELHGVFLDQLKRGHPVAIYGDLRDFEDTILVTGSRELNGQNVYMLRMERGELPPVISYIDPATGDVLRSEGVILAEGYIGIPVVSYYEDYREVHGVRIPFRTISENEYTGRSTVQFDAFEVNLDVDDEGIFTLVEPENR
jgi:CubicO group peptidase (beta-lactamase class C family)